MKNVLIGAIAILSITANAKSNCLLNVNLPESGIRSEVISILEQKGYTVSTSKEELELSIEVNKRELYTLSKVFVIAELSGKSEQLKVTKYKTLNFTSLMNKTSEASALEHQDYESESQKADGLAKAERLKQEVAIKIPKKLNDGVISTVSNLPKCSRFLDLSL